VKNIEVNKGKATLHQLYKKDYDFIMAIGDDHTDEDIFKAMPDSAYTFKVGSTMSAARYYLRNTTEVREFLNRLANAPVIEFSERIFKQRPLIKK
jgi:trehalose 6-phosphate synthase/phosphatase